MQLQSYMELPAMITQIIEQNGLTDQSVCGNDCGVRRADAALRSPTIKRINISLSYMDLYDRIIFFRKVLELWREYEMFHFVPAMVECTAHDLVAVLGDDIRPFLGLGYLFDVHTLSIGTKLLRCMFSMPANPHNTAALFDGILFWLHLPHKEIEPYIEALTHGIPPLYYDKGYTMYLPMLEGRVPEAR